MVYIIIAGSVLISLLIIAVILILSLIHKKKSEFTFDELSCLLFESEKRLHGNRNDEQLRYLKTTADECEFVTKTIIVDALNSSKECRDIMISTLVPLDLARNYDKKVLRDLRANKVGVFSQIPYITFSQIAVTGMSIHRVGVSLNDNRINTRVDAELILKSSEKFGEMLYTTKTSFYITYSTGWRAEIKKANFYN